MANGIPSAFRARSSPAGSHLQPCCSVQDARSLHALGDSVLRGTFNDDSKCGFAEHPEILLVLLEVSSTVSRAVDSARDTDHGRLSHQNVKFLVECSQLVLLPGPQEIKFSFCDLISDECKGAVISHFSQNFA
ncbi:hypothetical protein ACOJBM_40815 [Rhizobium beringeri]